MQIRLRSTGAIRNCSNDVGETMIAGGFADPLTPKEINALTTAAGVPYHEFHWSTSDGDWDDGCQYAPNLVWRCQTCAAISVYRPWKEPAADNVFHFEKQVCPEHIYMAYLKLFEAWSKKGSRRLKEPYERVLEALARRSKDGMDDDTRNRPPRDRVVTL